MSSVNIEILIEKWFNKKISLERIEKYYQQLRIKKEKFQKILTRKIFEFPVFKGRFIW